MIDKNLFFSTKKTTQLKRKEVEELVMLHNRVMRKERSISDFFEKYAKNFLGYSFHSLMFSKENIVGCNTVIPQEFFFFKKKTIFGQWCETLIDDKFRGDISNFKNLINNLNNELKKNNIFFIYGLPNRSLYIVSKRFAKMRDIGKLNYYLYPNDLKKFFTKLYPLNLILCLILKLILLFYPKFKKNYNHEVYKDNNEDFIRGRYSTSNKYNFVKRNNYLLTYRFDDNDDSKLYRIIRIIDVCPLTKFNLEDSVNYLIKNISNFDLIIYIGYLSAVPYNLIKVPDKLLKENRIFSGKILDETKIDKNIFNKDLWNVNSSNFDWH